MILSACVDVSVGSIVTENIIATVHCLGKRITDFVTSFPVGMTKSDVQNPSPGEYIKILII